MSWRGVFSDIRQFMLRAPGISTLVRFGSWAERQDYSSRIMQRLGIDVDDYAVLNIHRIGIEAPVSFVFEQLSSWGDGSSWWPNDIVRLEATDDGRQHIQVYLLGRKRHWLGIKSPLFGLNVIPLFEMDAVRVQDVPGTLDFDNARYLFYRCSGGYPVGVLVAYVRSPIAARGEPDQTQFFFAVGFNFYGKKDWPETHLISSIWERVHNRVTANVLNLFKGECEARFVRVQDPDVVGPGNPRMGRDRDSGQV